MLDYKQIAILIQIGPRYVTPEPLTPYLLGRKLYRLGAPITACTTDEMSRGYCDACLRNIRPMADAQTSAYLVGQGVES